MRELLKNEMGTVIDGLKDRIALLESDNVQLKKDVSILKCFSNLKKRSPPRMDKKVMNQSKARKIKMVPESHSLRQLLVDSSNKSATSRNLNDGDLLKQAKSVKCFRELGGSLE